jgi:hypothetical protein
MTNLTRVLLVYAIILSIVMVPVAVIARGGDAIWSILGGLSVVIVAAVVVLLIVDRLIPTMLLRRGLTTLRVSRSGRFGRLLYWLYGRRGDESRPESGKMKRRP